MQQINFVTLTNDCLFCGEEFDSPEAVEQHELRCGKEDK